MNLSLATIDLIFDRKTRGKNMRNKLKENRIWLRSPSSLHMDIYISEAFEVTERKTRLEIVRIKRRKQ